MESLQPISEELVKADSLESASETAAILDELERILASPFFCHTHRGKQFLSYVVRQRLEGHSENLKERSIGVAIFHRAANYATGDDPVVRVQAGEVRRRLNEYYQAFPDSFAVRIELPLGSYCPEFRRGAPPSPQPVEEISPVSPAPVSKEPRSSLNWWKAGFLGLFSIVAAFLVYTAFAHGFRSRAAHARPAVTLAQADVATPELSKFWAPVFATSQPVMIYLAKGVTYRPSPQIYEEYAQTHHGEFSLQVQRANEPLPLNPATKISWGQMILYTDYGIAAGDVDTAVRLSSLLGQLGKPEQVRTGANFSYADLSNSPTILLGAFNDEWTMKLMQNLHFALVDDGKSHLSLKEQVPHGREWPWVNVEKEHKDYGVVTRLVNSATGQFTVIIAGLSGSGTEAAGDFVTNEQILEDGTRNLPKGWQNKNLQLVLETDVTDSIPETPRVVASYSW